MTSRVRGAQVTDPIDKEAEAAWEAFAAKTDSYGGPAWVIASIWKAGFRAARSAAPVAPQSRFLMPGEPTGFGIEPASVLAFTRGDTFNPDAVRRELANIAAALDRHQKGWRAAHGIPEPVAPSEPKPEALPWDEGGRDAYFSKLPGDARLVAGLDPIASLASADAIHCKSDEHVCRGESYCCCQCQKCKKDWR